LNPHDKKDLMFPLITSERLAHELVEMFVLEQKLKEHHQSLYGDARANINFILFRIYVF
jgi:hypothetical protein